ncbi:MAG: hypothetical protein K8S97_12105 [Anaerolineae bacterium]|nr:hypothetical protein [Anaerolineae bacterium]
MDVSLITSLYQASEHLPNYTKYALDLAAELQRWGISLEIILVANDASDQEKRAIANLQKLASETASLTIKTVFVDRETVYASWNRGIVLSSGDYIGPWGVDDNRNADAVVEGYRLLKTGCELVDFPFSVVLFRKRLGVFRSNVRKQYPAPFDANIIKPKFGLSPFFLVSRNLYERAGSFNEKFHITGDFEWATRPAIRNAQYCAGTVSGGTFMIHGKNLSGGKNEREWAEFNIVLLRNQQWEAVRPVDPEIMRATWQTWQQEIFEVPEDIAERLWGNKAEVAWADWRRKKRRQQLSEKLHWFPRFLIDAFGLRPLFARLGIVGSSAE